MYSRSDQNIWKWTVKKKYFAGVVRTLHQSDPNTGGQLDISFFKPFRVRGFEISTCTLVLRYGPQALSPPPSWHSTFLASSLPSPLFVHEVEWQVMAIVLKLASDPEGLRLGSNSCTSTVFFPTFHGDTSLKIIGFAHIKFQIIPNKS
jgi:hypothetical protein